MIGMLDTGIPLGVRIYDIKDGVDVWVTKFVDDFSFRHTAPGGCASCTIKVHNRDNTEWQPSRIATLFYRVQIVDLRSAEILWEGRIEDPAEQVDDEVWEIGVLGSQVAATDVRMPVLYVDNTLDNWRIDEADAWDVDKNADTKTIEVKMKPGYLYGAGTEFITLHYNGLAAMAAAAARISMTYKGTGPGAQAANFDMLLDVNVLGNIDVTAFSAAQITKVNVVPADMSTTDWAQAINLEIRRRAGTGNYTIGASEEGIARFKYPKVVAVRFDELGNNLGAASDYAVDYLVTWQIIKDVIARFLDGGWKTGFYAQWNLSRASNGVYGSPAYGSVRGDNAFIDTTDTNRITNLWWTDPVDAKTILETMMLVQRNAYWAIWESGHRTFITSDYKSFPDVKEYQFRFEWARWPTSWNYLVSSADGMAQQTDGEQLYNSGAVIWEDPVWHSMTTTNVEDANTGTATQVGPTRWQTYELETRFTRFQTVVVPDAVEPGSWLSGEDGEYLRATLGATTDPLNSGTITIRRPIQFVDSGDSDGGGFAGMIDPWEIRPGRLLKIRDIHPLYNAGDFTFDMGRYRIMNTNTGFESGTSPYGSAGGSAFVVDTTQKYAGAQSGKITPTGAAADVYIATPWQVLNQQKGYRARAWVRCAVARAISIRIDFYNSTPTFISNVIGTVNVAANTWTYVEVSGIAPDNTTQGPALVIMSGTPAASNIMWVDEFKFEQIPAFPDGHQNSIFRVAATEYSTSDNSCKIELDQLPKWAIATQIANPGSAGGLAVK
jgi:carbohydrate binding protein with CBM4/9 domain